MTIARTLPLIGILLLTGCKNIKLPDLNSMTPKVRFDDVKLGKPDWQGVDAEFVLAIDNPNPVGIKLASWTWDLDIAGNDLLAGDQQDGAALEASGESKLAIPARLQFADLIKVGQAAKGQAEVPFTVSGTMGFNTPLGVVNVPWKDSGKLPVVRKPKIRVQGLKLSKLDVLGGRADLLLNLGVTHEGGGTLSLADVDWTLDLGGKRVADGKAAKLGEVAAGKESTISLPIGVKVVALGTSLVAALKNKESVKVNFGADANVGTPLGVLPLKISESNSVKVQ